jgi:hypothetical protein
LTLSPKGLQTAGSVTRRSLTAPKSQVEVWGETSFFGR